MRGFIPLLRSPRARAAVSAAAAAALTAAAGALVLLPGSPAQAAGTTQCKVAYSVTNDWGSGFSANVTITNLGSAWTSWTLGYSYAGNQTLSSGWNGTWTQSGKNVTVASLSWNGSVATNGTVTPAANFTYSGANAVPTTFTVNGTVCNGPSTPPSTSPSTTPSTSPSTSPSSSPSTSPSSSPSSSPSTSPSSQPSSSPPPAGAAPALHVSGNKLVTASGTPYRLLGVNRSSGEFACVQGKGMWDGPADQASVTAMKSWNVHAVRIPLNEECWLGNSDVPANGTVGAAYQQAVKDYANLLVANGINVILDLHWTYGSYTGPSSQCSDALAACQKPMPDAQYTPTFWTQVANAFKGNNAVIFDLFNEPFPDAANNYSNATAAWTCLRDGGTCAGIGYQVAGMQSLVNAVRSTGATNVVMTGGLSWTNDMSQWLTYKPADSTGNLMASWHSYSFNACVTSSCWNTNIASIGAKVPILAGEIGQNNCNHDYIDQLMAWADQNNVGYLAWTWNPWGVCASSGNDLITDWSGTPTATFGQGYKAHLLTQNP